LWKERKLLRNSSKRKLKREPSVIERQRGGPIPKLEEGRSKIENGSNDSTTERNIVKKWGFKMWGAERVWCPP